MNSNIHKFLISLISILFLSSVLSCASSSSKNSADDELVNIDEFLGTGFEEFEESEYMEDEMEYEEPSQNYDDKSELDLDIDQYLTYGAKKSYYLAMDGDGNWASGVAWDFPTQELADNSALIQCERQRAQNSILNPCKAYYRGNEKVGSM